MENTKISRNNYTSTPENELVEVCTSKNNTNQIYNKTINEWYVSKK